MFAAVYTPFAFRSDRFGRTGHAQPILTLYRPPALHSNLTRSAMRRRAGQIRRTSHRARVNYRVRTSTLQIICIRPPSILNE